MRQRYPKHVRGMVVIFSSLSISSCFSLYIAAAAAAAVVAELSTSRGEYLCVFEGRMLGSSRGGAVSHCGSSFHDHHVYGYGKQEARQQQSSLHPLSSPSFFSQTRMPELPKALSSLVLSSQRRPSLVTTAICSTKSLPKTTLQASVAMFRFLLFEGNFPLNFFFLPKQG